MHSFVLCLYLLLDIASGLLLDNAGLLNDAEPLHLREPAGVVTYILIYLRLPEVRIAVRLRAHHIAAHLDQHLHKKRTYNSSDESCCKTNFRTESNVYYCTWRFDD